MRKILTNTNFVGDISLGIRGEISSSGSINDQSTEDASVLYFSGNNPILSGLVNSDIDNEKIIFLCFSGTGQMTLLNQSTNSSVNNRFLFADSSIVLLPNQSIVLIYDSSTLKWRNFYISPSTDPNRTTFSLANGASIIINSTSLFSTVLDGSYSIWRNIDATTAIEFNLKNGTPPDILVKVLSTNIQTTDIGSGICFFISGNNLILKNYSGSSIDFICVRKV